MADEPKVSPTIDDPKKGSVNEGANDPSQEAAALLEELKSMGVETPEQVRGMAKASSESGRLANMLGELRQQNAYLAEELKSMKRAPKRQQWNDDDDLGDQSASSIDLGELVSKQVRKELHGFWNETQRQQHEMRERQWSEWRKIEGDRNYPMVKNIWEKHVQNPQVQYDLQSGVTTASDEYNKVVVRYLEAIAKRSRDVIEGFQGKSKVAPPHMESGAPPAPTKEGDASPREQMRKVAEKGTGSDDDIDALINAAIPKGDRIFQYGD